MIYLLLIFMTILGAIASYFLKNAAVHNTLLSSFKDKYLYLGGTLYFISALLNIFILKFLDYSIVFPLTSLTYIWTLIISWRLLSEKINTQKICGISLIVLGAILVSQ